MTQLRLFVENFGKSYTLKPNREYVAGSGSDCNIPLPDINVASQHLKFSFNQLSNTWHVYDLGSGNGTFIENQRIGDYPITRQTRLALANRIFLVATPEGSEVPRIQQPTAPTTYSWTPTPPPSSPVSPNPFTFPSRTRLMEKNYSFLRSFSDLSFTRFIAIRVIGFLYILGVLIGLLPFFAAIGGGFSQGFLAGVGVLIVAPFILILYLLLIRLILEGFVAGLRTAENTTQLVELQRIQNEYLESLLNTNTSVLRRE